jgi:hypothetical protein
MVMTQLDFTFNNRAYKGVLRNTKLAIKTLEASFYIAEVAFNLAYWFFVFSYLVLSYRIEPITNNLPKDTYNFRLNSFNILVILLNVVMRAIFFIYILKGEVRVINIIGNIE